MSVSYLIAFDKDLSKTNYLYKYILNSKKTVWSIDDGIVFSDKLYPQEKDIAKNLFPQRKVYSIRSSVPLSFKNSDKENVCEDYYICEQEQIQWFVKFLKKHIKYNEDALFLKINLGHPINYRNILTKQVDVNEIEISDEEFCFDDYIYQFVNTKQNNKSL